MLLSKNKNKNTDANYSHNVKKIEKMINDINIELSFLEKETIKNEKYLKELEEESKVLNKSIKENETLSQKYGSEINELNNKSEKCVEQKRQCQQKISEGTTNLNEIKCQIIEVNDNKIYEFLTNILFKTIIVKSLESCENYLEDNYNCVNIDGDYPNMVLCTVGIIHTQHGIYTAYNKLTELKEEGEKREESYRRI
ncbi:hypothetical protein PFDG_03368 [Plasmodium falciparum Dd2]|uniref:Uncharacterized protein n=1 Tax=Plasmodium falciparum (isolate Dd2) TaxID=57267 RepID=A0A0L7M312_PLAF4|nr:hypothetical protein PFDG_03368 [Plasmodium falciparum Dd2]